MPIPIILLIIAGILLFIIVTYALVRACGITKDIDLENTEQTQFIQMYNDKVVIKQTQNGKDKSKTIVRTDKPITVINENNSNSNFNSDLP